MKNIVFIVLLGMAAPIVTSESNPLIKYPSLQTRETFFKALEKNHTGLLTELRTFRIELSQLHQGESGRPLQTIFTNVVHWARSDEKTIDNILRAPVQSMSLRAKLCIVAWNISNLAAAGAGFLELMPKQNDNTRPELVYANRRMACILITTVGANIITGGIYYWQHNKAQTAVDIDTELQRLTQIDDMQRLIRGGTSAPIPTVPMLIPRL